MMLIHGYEALIHGVFLHDWSAILCFQKSTFCWTARGGLVRPMGYQWKHCSYTSTEYIAHWKVGPVLRTRPYFHIFRLEVTDVDDFTMTNITIKGNKRGWSHDPGKVYFWLKKNHNDWSMGSWPKLQNKTEVAMPHWPGVPAIR